MDLLINISKDTLRHIYEKHEDLIKILSIKDMEELKEAILDVLQDPDEIHEDKYKNYVKYYLKKINALWINVVLVYNTVKTAYLISPKSYRKFKEKRWR